MYCFCFGQGSLKSLREAYLCWWKGIHPFLQFSFITINKIQLFPSIVFQFFFFFNLLLFLCLRLGSHKSLFTCICNGQCKMFGVLTLVSISKEFQFFKVSYSIMWIMWLLVSTVYLFSSCLCPKMMILIHNIQHFRWKLVEWGQVYEMNRFSFYIFS
jgi:hypothetical protein